MPVGVTPGVGRHELAGVVSLHPRAAIRSTGRVTNDCYTDGHLHYGRLAYSSDQDRAGSVRFTFFAYDFQRCTELTGADASHYSRGVTEVTFTVEG